MTPQHPDLTQCLQKQDLGFMRIVAELWGLDIKIHDAHTAIPQIVLHLVDPDTFYENIELLPHMAREALEELTINAGVMPWSQFIRRYGEVREMGPGRRDREKPYFDPISPSETLWYQGLIGRTFFDKSTGAREYAYIPRDLFALLPFSQNTASSTPGREASSRERLHPLPTSDRILDHACTLLAASRTGLPDEEFASLSDQWAENSPPPFEYRLTIQTLQTILFTAGILDKDGNPKSEPVRIFLEASRGEALSQLVSSYLNSPDFNELHLIPDLRPEGTWKNDPLQTRKEIFNFLSRIPDGTWWSLNDFIVGIHEHHPDFQRPTGDYDSWFIRDINTGEFLRGFVHWDKVEGALIRYTITGMLYWLGIVELAAPSVDAPIKAFRLSKWSHALLKGEYPEGMPEETDTILVTSEARLRVPRLTTRVTRYQIARFCLWDGEDEEIYKYQISPESLERARKQGLQINHLLTILRRYASTIPPTLVKGLERWEERGTEARVEHPYVLRLSSPDILKELRSSRAARFLGEPLGPTAIIIKPGAREKVIAILAEIGYLGEKG
ncbi:MAG: helicase-associated domain-containing protein [Anaerolineales bacterium]|nr:helicase-associated domain-containing protein [Anaerolineales bacterium]